MTDTQIILGIQTNNPIVWKYICRNLKSPFIATLKKYINTTLYPDDWDDVFQETCVTLMENLKRGKFEERPGSTLFSYFLEIGKRTMQTALRKKAKHHPTVKTEVLNAISRVFWEYPMAILTDPLGWFHDVIRYF